MRFPLAKTTTLLAIILVTFSTIPVTLAQDYTLSYQLLNQPNGKVTYELNVAIPQTLHEYYE
jgi:hypothetical protein